MNAKLDHPEVLHEIIPGEDLILWCDFETTGLVAFEDMPLEVAAIFTDLDYNIVSPFFQRTIKYSPEETAKMRAGADQFVRNMHASNGLWAALATGTPIETVRDELQSFVKEYAPHTRQARLGGNSCTLDINFLSYHFADVYEHLHYRIVDISSLAYLMHEKHRVPIYKKEMTHRALDDILETIAEAKYLDEKIQVKK